MDVIQAARQLGKTIQEDERWINLQLVQQRNEKDEELQAMISEFEVGRLALNTEIQKPDRDQDRIKELDAQVREVYGHIFQREGMVEFSRSREEVNTLLQFINQIITGSAEGRDPDSIEFEESCGGDCGGCSGCG